jgi:hypothetical protein
MLDVYIMMYGVCLLSLSKFVVVCMYVSCVCMCILYIVPLLVLVPGVVV